MSASGSDNNAVKSAVIFCQRVQHFSNYSSVHPKRGVEHGTTARGATRKW
jgi:hypothetical protein